MPGKPASTILICQLRQLDLRLRWRKKDPISRKILDRNENFVYDSRKEIETRLSIIPNWSISSLETVVISPLCQMERCSWRGSSKLGSDCRGGNASGE